MWALAPETEGVGCEALGGVADALCRRPELRGLPPPALARALGVAPREARAGIERLAIATTGRTLAGASLDEVLGLAGRPAAPVPILYAPDASGLDDSPDAAGGYGTPARPELWGPGMTEPAARFLPSAPRMTIQVAPFPQAPPVSVEVPADLEARDALVRLGVVKLARGFGPQSWADLLRDYGDVGAFAASVQLRRMLPFGNLLEDCEFQDEPGQPWFGWPGGNDHATRQVFAWALGPDAVYQHMQVQKFDGAAKRWRIFNQWGQDLTFVRPAPGAAWSAGWDAGDWTAQHAREIAQAFATALQALMTVMSFGAGSAAMAATAAGQAAAYAFSSGMKAIITGDWSAAIGDFLKMAGSLAALDNATGHELSKKLSENVPDAMKDLANSDAVKGIAGLVADTQSSDVFKLVERAQAIGKQLATVTDAGIAQMRAKMAEASPSAGPYFDRGVAAGLNLSVPDVRGSVPWYALGAFDAGASLGAIVQAQRVQVVSAGVRGLMRQQAAAAAFATAPAAVAPMGGGGALAGGAIAFRRFKPMTAPAPVVGATPVSGGAAVAVGGAGLLALLFFL